MSGYLLDTNIISKFAPDRRAPTDATRYWFHEHGDVLYLSTMTIAEIEKGLRSLHRRGGVERASRLTVWLETLAEQFGDRILPMDAIVARGVGLLADDADSRGINPGLADLIIAATARAYRLTIITENLRHFAELPVRSQLPSALIEA